MAALKISSFLSRSASLVSKGAKRIPYSVRAIANHSTFVVIEEPIKPSINIDYTKLLIGGKFVDSASGKTFLTIDLRTGEVITDVVEGDSEATGRKVFHHGPWPKMTVYERSRELLRLADLIEEHAVKLATLEALDNGKPYLQALKIEIPMCARLFRYYAERRFWTRRELEDEELEPIKELFKVQKEDSSCATLFTINNLQAYRLLGNNFLSWYKNLRRVIPLEDRRKEIVDRWVAIALNMEDDDNADMEIVGLNVPPVPPNVDLDEKVASPDTTTGTKAAGGEANTGPMTAGTDEAAPSKKTKSSAGNQAASAKHKYKSFAEKIAKALETLGNEDVEGFVVPEELKEELLYSLQALIRDIGEHYTVEQWSSITPSDVKGTWVQLISALMTASSLGSHLPSQILNLKKEIKEGAVREQLLIKKVEDGVERERKLAETVKILTKKVQVVENTIAEVCSDLVISQETGRIREAQIDELRSQYERLQVLHHTLKNERLQWEADREWKIVVARQEALDTKKSFIQATLRRFLRVGYLQAIKDMKTQVSGADLSFFENELRILSRPPGSSPSQSTQQAPPPPPSS